MKKKIICFLIIYSLFVSSVIAKGVDVQDQPISLNLQHVRLSDAVHIISKMTNENIIVSSTIHSDVTLHLHNVSAKKILSLLLISHDLLKVPMGGVWYITPRNDWVQREKDQFKATKEMESVTPLDTRIWKIHYAKSSDVSHLLQDSTSSLLSKRGHVRVDSRTNILYVQDIASNLEKVNQLIKRIDIPVQQVLIEARLASVDSDFERDLGVIFGLKNTSDPGQQSNSFLAKAHYGLLVAKLADGSLLDVQLSALQNSGHGELISNPRLFTANQQTASIESGEEIPYQEESPSGGTSVVFKKAVLSLRVTPQILPGNKVLLQLQINQDRPSKLVIQGVPAISTRQMSTHVLIGDGQTVVLGGIYESDKEQAKQSIPYLSKIPLLGLLFQQNDRIEKKRELLIFVTPRIIPLDV